MAKWFSTLLLNLLHLLLGLWCRDRLPVTVCVEISWGGGVRLC